MGSRSAQEIWEAALGELQIQVSKPNYRTWLEKTVGLVYQDNRFLVGVPNIFVAEYLDRNQRSLIEKTLINLTSAPDIRVNFQVNGRAKTPSVPYGADGRSSATSQFSHRLKPNYVFESFIVGSCNQLAFTAARGVAQNPGGNYNPLFIYGGAGLGKTHLLHAIGHTALANQGRVICISAEQFTNEFVSALREKRTEEFRNRYRNAGVLLIDDIYFIKGKKQTEETFFHIFNELHNANRQIVITSDQPPKAMTPLAERLRSRFEWGLVVDIQPPNFETRLAILQAKARQRAVDIAFEVLEFIARQLQQNIRELEGSLNRVIAYARLFQAAPSIDLAAQALKHLSCSEPGTSQITPGLVIKAAAESFRLSPDDLKGGRRDKETSQARRVAMYIVRQETNSSVALIGQEMGGRDPSSVTNACKKVASDIATSPYLRRKVQDIQRKINSAPDNGKR